MVKIDNTRFLTLLISGSNNSTETLYNRNGKSYERRERNWINDFIACPSFRYKLMTKEETMQSLRKTQEHLINQTMSSCANDDFKDMTRQESHDYISKHFGYYTSVFLYRHITSPTTCKNVEGFYKYGFKYAFTLDQLAKANYPLNLSIIHRNKDNYTNVYDVELNDKNAVKEIESLKSIDWNCYSVNIYIQGISDEKRLTHLRSSIFNIKRSYNKQSNQPKDYYIVITQDNYCIGYVAERSGKSRMRWSHSFKTHFTKQSAIRKAKCLNNAWGNKYKFRMET